MRTMHGIGARFISPSARHGPMHGELWGNGLINRAPITWLGKDYWYACVLGRIARFSGWREKHDYFLRRLFSAGPLAWPAACPDEQFAHDLAAGACAHLYRGDTQHAADLAGLHHLLWRERAAGGVGSRCLRQYVDRWHRLPGAELRSV